MKYFSKTLKWHNFFKNKGSAGKREQKKRQKINHMRTEVGKDVTKLKKLRVPELNKYLDYHRPKQHLKSRKSEKIKAIVRHLCLQQKSLLRAGQPTLRNARTLTQNDNRAALTAVKRMKVTISVMPLTLG